MSVLNINNDQTFLLDGNGMLITIAVEDGLYTFKGKVLPPPQKGARIFVDPTEIINFTIRPCMTFFINISVDDVENLHTCIFNLSYNTEILSWVSVSMLRIQGKLPSATMDANDDEGYLWIKLVYPMTINFTTYDPTPLVKIELHVDALGTSPLDLHDTQIIDIYDRQMDHKEQDGLFMSQVRDVAILNVTPSQNWTYPNRLLNINVTAANLGTVNETLEVKLYGNTTLIGTQVVNLTASSQITLVFTWNTALALPCHKYFLSANVTPVPFELNLTNNQFTDGFVKVYYLGDINRDGIVNMTDIYAIILAFLSEPGDARWNPNLDVIQDNIINMMDVYKAVLNFQKGCPS
jgi:hypothetical protein